MLVLTRREGEKITLELPNGEKIILILLNIVNSKAVRLGIEAPKIVKITRNELFERENY